MKKFSLVILLLATQSSFALIHSNVASYKANGDDFFRVNYTDKDIKSYNQIVTIAQNSGVEIKNKCVDRSVGVDEFGDVLFKQVCILVFYRKDDGGWNKEGEHHRLNFFTASPTITAEFFQDSLIGSSMIQILDQNLVNALRKNLELTSLKRLKLNQRSCRRVGGGASNSSGNGTTCKITTLFEDLKTQLFHASSDKRILCGSSKNKYMKGCYFVVNSNGSVFVQSK